MFLHHESGKHDVRKMIFPGGQHFTIQNNFPDWLMGCLGITETCTSTCETSFLACVNANDGTFETCRDKMGK
jgi:hypothetical protein